VRVDGLGDGGKIRDGVAGFVRISLRRGEVRLYDGDHDVWLRVESVLLCGGEKGGGC